MAEMRALTTEPMKCDDRYRYCPVVLDLGRVLAEQVRLERLDHRLGRPLPAVDAAFANPDRPVLAVDPHQQPAIPQDRLDLLDRLRGRQPPSGARRRARRRRTLSSRRQLEALPPLTSLWGRLGEKAKGTRRLRA